MLDVLRVPFSTCVASDLSYWSLWDGIFLLCAANFLSFLLLTAVLKSSFQKQSLPINENVWAWICLSVLLCLFLLAFRPTVVLLRGDGRHFHVVFLHLSPLFYFEIPVRFFIRASFYSCISFIILFFFLFFASLSYSLCFPALAVGVKLGECDRKREAAEWEWKSVEGWKKGKVIMKSLI